MRAGLLSSFLLALMLITSSASVKGDPPLPKSPKALTLDPKDYPAPPSNWGNYVPSEKEKKREEASGEKLEKYKGHPIRFSGRVRDCYADNVRKVYCFVIAHETTEERGELDPITHFGRPLIVYLAENSRPLREELRKADTSKGKLVVTIESNSWEYQDFKLDSPNTSATGFPYHYKTIVCNKTTVVSKQIVVHEVQPAGPMVSPVQAAGEGKSAEAEKSFEKLVAALPGLWTTAKLPDQLEGESAKFAKSTSFVKIGFARMTGANSAKISIVFGQYNAEDKKESAIVRIYLYLSYYRGFWTITNSDGPASFLKQGEVYSEAFGNFCFAIDKLGYPSK